MPTINFISVQQFNPHLAVQVDDIVNGYLNGVPLCTQNGTKFNTSDIAKFIEASQSQLEQMLEIKLKKTVYHERCDFIYDQWKSWGYIKTTMPVRKVFRLNGLLSNVQQVEYPNEWVSLYMNENDPERLFRNVYIVPNGGGMPINSGSVLYLGITPHLGFFSMDYVPNYWDVTYCTGFDKIPADITATLSKMVAVQTLAVIGDVLYTPGLQSQSLSFDGLSQSTSTTVSTNVFKARITQYQTEIQTELKQLREIYRGISFMAL